jgi:hypothetical protein
MIDETRESLDATIPATPRPQEVVEVVQAAAGFIEGLTLEELDVATLVAAAKASGINFDLGGNQFSLKLPVAEGQAAIWGNNTFEAAVPEYLSMFSISGRVAGKPVTILMSVAKNVAGKTLAGIAPKYITAAGKLSSMVYYGFVSALQLEYIKQQQAMDITYIDVLAFEEVRIDSMMDWAPDKMREAAPHLMTSLIQVANDPETVAKLLDMNILTAAGVQGGSLAAKLAQEIGRNHTTVFTNDIPVREAVAQVLDLLKRRNGDA